MGSWGSSGVLRGQRRMWTEEESGEDTPGGRATKPFLGWSEQSLGHGTRAGPWASSLAPEVEAPQLHSADRPRWQTSA